MGSGIGSGRGPGAPGRPRARALGLPFEGTPGPLNALTDVPGVGVGYTTLIEGDSVRTGVTAILPRGAEGLGVACAAGWSALNGNGEMTGTTWLTETGSLTQPVLITNTHAVGTVHRGAIDWVNAKAPRVGAAWMLPVVAETWDGYLNDINGAHVRGDHAGAALDAAAHAIGRPVAEGNVGGGTGMNCYEFKGGSGTSSRVVAHGSGPDALTFTVAAFVQANFGARAELRLAGVPLGLEMSADNPIAEPGWFDDDLRRAGAGRTPNRTAGAATTRSAAHGAGSVIVVLATDAPLLPAQLTAMTRRVPLGLARTGTAGGHFSGDIFVAFSTANPGALGSHFPEESSGPGPLEKLSFIPWGWIDPFFTATVQAVEEAVVNALVAAEPMTGRHGHRMPALDLERTVSILRARGAIL